PFLSRHQQDVGYYVSPPGTIAPLPATTGATGNHGGLNPGTGPAPYTLVTIVDMAHRRTIFSNASPSASNRSACVSDPASEIISAGSAGAEIDAITMLRAARRVGTLGVGEAKGAGTALKVGYHGSPVTLTVLLNSIHPSLMALAITLVRAA